MSRPRRTAEPESAELTLIRAQLLHLEQLDALNDTIRRRLQERRAVLLEEDGFYAIHAYHH